MKSQLLESVREIEELYEELLGRVRDLQGDLRHDGDPGAKQISRRMDAYTIPWLEAFLERDSQPGSIADIKGDIEKLDDEDEE